MISVRTFCNKIYCAEDGVEFRASTNGKWSILFKNSHTKLLYAGYYPSAKIRDLVLDRIFQRLEDGQTSFDFKKGYLSAHAEKWNDDGVLIEEAVEPSSFSCKILDVASRNLDE